MTDEEIAEVSNSWVYVLIKDNQTLTIANRAAYAYREDVAKDWCNHTNRRLAGHEVVLAKIGRIAEMMLKLEFNEIISVNAANLNDLSTVNMKFSYEKLSRLVKALDGNNTPN